MGEKVGADHAANQLRIRDGTHRPTRPQHRREDRAGWRSAARVAAGLHVARCERFESDARVESVGDHIAATSRRRQRTRHLPNEQVCVTSKIYERHTWTREKSPHTDENKHGARNALCFLCSYKNAWKSYRIGDSKEVDRCRSAARRIDAQLDK